MEESWVKLFEEQTRFYNEVFLPRQLCLWLPHHCQTWLRLSLVGGLIYFGTSLLCLDFWRRYFSQGSKFISKQVLLSHIYFSMKSIPVFTLMMTGFEYMVLKGWTKCFPKISDVGLVAYFCYIILYLVVVEIGIYWVHRAMHGVKPIYKYIHAAHHLYVKETTISPFAGAAAHPLDEMLMASPHGIAILVVPCHFSTFLVIFLVEAIWGIIIHDRSQGLGWPFLSAPYHTIHHTSQHRNFGNFTIWMDQLFGTISHPKSYLHHVQN